MKPSMIWKDAQSSKGRRHVCFESKPTFVDLILTNRKYSFKNTNTFLHKTWMLFTIWKKQNQKSQVSLPVDIGKSPPLKGLKKIKKMY